MLETASQLTQTVALIGLAAGGYFVGGIANNLAAGESVGRMFSGSTTEQALQLLAAGLLVWIGAGVIL
jgi:hypothetical protein